MGLWLYKYINMYVCLHKNYSFKSILMMLIYFCNLNCYRIIIQKYKYTNFLVVCLPIQALYTFSKKKPYLQLQYSVYLYIEVE